MNDNISRQAAIEEIQPFGEYESNRTNKEWVRLFTIILKHLPSTDRKGHWIKMPEFCGDDVSGFIDNHFRCSECWKEAEINSWGFYILSDFCPHCGADMRKGDLE